MGDFPQTAGWGVLKFFGRMFASISHELKNSLSIVNENAGLMEDLARLSEKGGNLDVERVKALSVSIGRQVKRTDQIIRNMNKFAHSVDMEIKTVDVQEYLELTAAVSARLLAAKNITLELAPPRHRANISTSPIFLLYLFWHLIDCCSRWTQKGETLRTELDSGGNLVTVQFKGCMAADPDFKAEVEEGDLDALLSMLGCSLEFFTTERTLRLSFLTNFVKDG
jgi:light-regulated signal transduction histidine kinase (bacteriophytochrome)